MEHFQAALDPRKQELLEARFLGARMSAGTQLQMAPQTTIVQQVGQNHLHTHHLQHPQQQQQQSALQVQQSQQHYSNHQQPPPPPPPQGTLVAGGLGAPPPIGTLTSLQQQSHYTNNNKDQDSNMSTGSSHSDKELETIINTPTPEKIPRTPSDRKRKRKAPDDNGGPGGGGGDHRLRYRPDVTDADS